MTYSPSKFIEKLDSNLEKMVERTRAQNQFLYEFAELLENHKAIVRNPNTGLGGILCGNRGSNGNTWTLTHEDLYRFTCIAGIS